MLFCVPHSPNISGLIVNAPDCWSVGWGSKAHVHNELQKWPNRDETWGPQPTYLTGRRDCGWSDGGWSGGGWKGDGRRVVGGVVSGGRIGGGWGGGRSGGRQRSGGLGDLFRESHLGTKYGVSGFRFCAIWLKKTQSSFHKFVKWTNLLPRNIMIFCESICFPFRFQHPKFHKLFLFEILVSVKIWPREVAFSDRWNFDEVKFH